MSVTVLVPLTINIVGQGSVSGGAVGTTWVKIGTAYSLTASPGPGYAFASWTGPRTVFVPTFNGAALGAVTLTATFTSTTTLSVNTSGPGSVTPMYAGSTTQVAGAHLTVGAIPNSGARFTGWTGSVVSSQQTLSLNMTSVMTLTANFESLALYAGVYVAAGIVNPSNESSFLKLTVSSAGGFAGSITLPSGTHVFAGNFASPDGFSGAVAGGIMHLQVASGATVPELTGTLSIDGQTITLSGARLAVASVKSPSPFAGKYTALFPRAADANAPEGYGYGTASVTNTGLAKFIGRLSDNTPFSAGATLSESGSALISVPLYRKKGYLQGWVQFRDQPGESDFDGTLAWTRPASTGTLPYAKGFGLSIEMIGSLLPAPSSTANVFGLSSGTVAFAGGGLTTGISTTATISSKNLVVPTPPNPNRVQFVVSAKSGTVAGKFTPIGAKSALTFHGVVFPKSQTASGFFMNAGRSGSALLQP
jgi:hypothetical protein